MTGDQFHLSGFEIELPSEAAMTTMRKGASISSCELYRWTLTRDWADGARVCWVMLNPSDADHEIDDPTILRSWGYSGFTVVNLYPFRSPSPPKCKEWATDKKLVEAVK